MQVIVVDLRDVGVRHNYEREVSKCLYAMCEAVWKEGKGEIGGGEESFYGERRAAMSRRLALAGDSKPGPVTWDWLTVQDLPNSMDVMALRQV